MLVGDRDRGRSALLPLDITCLLADASKSGQLSDKRMKRWRHVICLMAHQREKGRAEPRGEGVAGEWRPWLCAGGKILFTFRTLPYTLTDMIVVHVEIILCDSRAVYSCAPLLSFLLAISLR